MLFQNLCVLALDSKIIYQRFLEVFFNGCIFEGDRPGSGCGCRSNCWSVETWSEDGRHHCVQVALQIVVCVVVHIVVHVVYGDITVYRYPFTLWYALWYFLWYTLVHIVVQVVVHVVVEDVVHVASHCGTCCGICCGTRYILWTPPTHLDITVYSIGSSSSNGTFLTHLNEKMGNITVDVQWRDFSVIFLLNYFCLKQKVNHMQNKHPCRSKIDEKERERKTKRWKMAVERSLGWDLEAMSTDD